MILAALLSTLAATIAAAHEVLPAIGDMERRGEVLEFGIDAAFEGIVAGVDLSEVSDTNDSAQAADYDALRALPPEEFEARMEAYWPQLAQRIDVRDETGAALPLSFVSAATEAGAPDDLARTTRLTFTAALPAGARAASFGWDRAFGAIVLRQQGV